MRQRWNLRCAAVAVLLVGGAGGARAAPAPAEKRACDLLKPEDVGTVVGRAPAAPAVSTTDGCAYHDQASGLALTLVLHGPATEGSFAELRKRRAGARDEAGLGVPAFSEEAPSAFLIYALGNGRVFSLTLDGTAVPAGGPAKVRALAKTLLGRLSSAGSMSSSSSAGPGAPERIRKAGRRVRARRSLPGASARSFVPRPR